MSDEANVYGVTAEDLARYADSFNGSAILELFGIRLEFPDLLTVRAVIDAPRPGHKGGRGEGSAFNGGVLAALYDLVVGCAAATVDPRRQSATIQLSMNFERAVEGDQVAAEASVDRAGNTLVFVSARILDGQGQVCSHGQGVVRMSRHSWKGASPAEF
jgi:uncharacterized protein (TIGR00369 family)